MFRNLEDQALFSNVAVDAGIDAMQYGKQWIVARGAMEREYGAVKF